MRSCKTFQSASLAALLVAALPMGAAAATLNECKLPDGRTVLLWEKCPEGAEAAPPAAAPAPQRAEPPKAATVPAAPQAAKPGAAAPGPFAPTPKSRHIDREMVVEIMSGYAVCAEDVEGFGSRYSASYDFWKLRNSAAIARAQNDPAARRMMAERIREGRSPAGGTDPEKKNYCEKLIGPFLQGKFAGS